MHRVNLDVASRSVRDFFQRLPVDTEGVEIEVAGKVCYKVIPPNPLSEAEKKVIDDARRIMRRSQERNKGVPARLIEREIRDAIDEVRGRMTSDTSSR